MPFSIASPDPNTSQTGIAKPGTSIPSPQGVSSSSYPTPTPMMKSSDGMGKGEKTSEVDTSAAALAYNQQMNQKVQAAYNAANGPGLLEYIAMLGGALAVGPAIGSVFATGTPAAAVTGAESAAGAGQIAASTAAAGEGAAATSAAAATAAGTLPEVVATAAPLAPSAFTGVESLGLAAGGAGALSSALDLTGASGSTMPAVNASASGFQPNWSQIGQNALKRGAINSAISAITGGNPLKGFASGAIGGAIGAGLGQYEAATGALDALGKTPIAGINAAISGGATAAIMGGNPLKAALTGGVAGAAGSALSSILGTAPADGQGSFDPGAIIGGQAAGVLMSRILGTSSPVAGGVSGLPTSYKPPGTGGTGATGPTGATGTNGPTADITVPKPTALGTIPVSYPTTPFFGVGFGGGGGGGQGPSGDDYSYFDEQNKLKRLLAALQQGGAYG